MIAKFARFIFYALLALLAWQTLVSPATRARFRYFVEVLAFALLASSAILIAYHFLVPA